MKKPTIYFLGLMVSLFSTFALSAQDPVTPEKEKKAKAPTPKNMLEFGVNGGLGLVSGEIELLPSYVVGLHVRKALDYVFSLRGDFKYALLRGAEGKAPFREFETQWRSGTVFGVVSLNSLRWNAAVRSSNFYFMAGAGLGNFDTDFKQSVDPRIGELKGAFTSHVAGGIGLSVRLGNKLNIGLEQQALQIFGKDADFVDGFNTRIGNTDIVAFSTINVNFNIGNKANYSEPLYWINPLQEVISDIKELKSRPEVRLDDSDQDGVLDALDMEPETPPGAVVDTKGRTLDSDRDGVPDYLDREPFYTPAGEEMVNEEGVVINPGAGRINGGVTEDRVKELIDEAFQNNSGGNMTVNSNTNLAEWFLPMIHFNFDQTTIKYSDYGTLASIARVLRSNPGLRLVVTGFADGSGAELYNNKLSYNRAKAVIDHLVNTHNIGRGRFVLQWKGSGEILVPSKTNFMNRRVEFRIAAAGDVEMDPPGGTTGGY